MISILSLLLVLSYLKFLVENSLIVILMVMEMISMLTFFLLMDLNCEAMGLSSCVVTILSVLISEGVLSLSIFVNLVRISNSEKVTSLMLSH